MHIFADQLSKITLSNGNLRIQLTQRGAVGIDRPVAGAAGFLWLYGPDVLCNWAVHLHWSKSPEKS
jgi:hypothetical protein